MGKWQRIEPGPGQESVWDYPRPPRVENVPQRIRVMFNGEVIADTTRAKRVLETASPPTYYIPPEDVQMARLTPARGQTWCEWKGQANYFDVIVGERASRRAAWCYANPTVAFREIAGYVSFYAGRVDACYVDEEQVQPQAGDFYGGWITSRIVGPYKGEPGSSGW